MNSNLLYLVLYFCVSFAFLFGLLRLLTWPLRKKNSGILLLDVGRIDMGKCSFWGGVGMAASQTLIILIDGIPGKEKGLLFLINYTLALHSIANGSHLEFRSNGICYQCQWIKWEEIKSYQWERTALTIKFKKRGSLFLIITTDYQDTVNGIISEHLPEISPCS